MADLAKRQLVMQRSLALGHCVCNPRQPCPCPSLNQQDLCPCAGERPAPSPKPVRLTRLTRKAGCASKISHTDLQRVLRQLPSFPDERVLVGIAAGDDAGVFQLNGQCRLVQTVDVFSPVCDDPYVFGRIAAANSVSDIYAMGARPVCALSIIGFPIESVPSTVMTEILRGGLEALHEAGVSVIGGHSIDDEDLKAGFAVTGLLPDGPWISNASAQPGDMLVLTKPLGAGLITFAAQLDLAPPGAMEALTRSMMTFNRDAAELMAAMGAHACTDITGFGLLGHLLELCTYSQVSVRLELAQVPVFGAAAACLEAELIPGAVERNREAFAQALRLEGTGPEQLLTLLFDPQTSGGLLVALPAESAAEYVQAMHARGHTATAIIGAVLPPQEKPITVALAPAPHWIGPQMPLLANNMPEPVCCAENHQIPDIQEENTPMQAMPIQKNFKEFMQAAQCKGQLDLKTKKLITIALTIAQRCESCLKLHYQSALSAGCTPAEIEEAAWLAVAMCGAPAKVFYDEVRQKMEST